MCEKAGNSLWMAIAFLLFPSISTGVYRYPIKDAAKTAVRAVLRFAENEQSGIERVILACFDDRTLEAYQTEIDRQ